MKRLKKIYNDFLAYLFILISVCLSFYVWYYTDSIMQYNDAILCGFLVFVFSGCALVALYEKLQLK